MKRNELPEGAVVMHCGCKHCPADVAVSAAKAADPNLVGKDVRAVAHNFGGLARGPMAAALIAHGPWIVED